jgi:putative Mn2+ efflux pump MntP
MNLETILIAVGLGMDTFAVGVGSGTVFEPPVKRSVFRLSFHFGLFQSLLFVTGYFAGRSIVEVIAAWDHYAALGLLLFVGLRMVREGMTRGDEEALRADPSRGWRLVMLSVATSIDALAVGLSFGVLAREVLLPALVIGGVSCAMTLAGIFVGRRLKAGFGSYAEIVGGLILIGIGVKIFVENTVFDARNVAFLMQTW